MLWALEEVFLSQKLQFNDGSGGIGEKKGYAGLSCHLTLTVSKLSEWLFETFVFTSSYRSTVYPHICFSEKDLLDPISLPLRVESSLCFCIYVGRSDVRQWKIL